MFAALALFITNRRCTDSRRVQVNDTIRDVILTSARKLTKVAKSNVRNKKIKQWKKKKNLNLKTDMLRSIGKQSGESVESKEEEGYGKQEG